MNKLDELDRLLYAKNPVGVINIKIAKEGLKHWRDKAIAAHAAQLIAEFEGIVPAMDNRQHAIKGVDQGIQIGFNYAIAEIRTALAALRRRCE